MTTWQTHEMVAEARREQILAGIRHYSSACGCEVGSASMLSAIIAYLAYLLCSENSWSVGESVLYGALWVILMSTAGKLLGLAFARVRLHMLRTTLRREFSANSDKNARWK